MNLSNVNSPIYHSSPASVVFVLIVLFIGCQIPPGLALFEDLEKAHDVHVFFQYHLTWMGYLIFNSQFLKS